MKKIFNYRILIVLVILTGSMKAQWFSQESNSQRNLRDIKIFNEDKVIVVGSYGTIRKTFDGGNNWIIVPHDTADQPNAIFFVSDSIGWMAGAGISWGGGGGAIQKTTDGGSYWTNQYNFFEIGMSSINFLDENIGWAAGISSGDGNLSGVLIKTTNGGTNWENQDTDTLDGLWFSTFFANNNIGWLAGINGWSNSRILRTSDGGNSWLSGEFLNVILNSIYFINQNTGWAVGSEMFGWMWYGTIFNTSNGGADWNGQIIAGNITINDVYFANEYTGWVVCQGGTILKTTDGGNNWFSQESGTNQNLNAICFLDENIGWAVGDSGTILKTINGGGVVPVEITSFTAISHNDFVELKWTTATEINNQGFEVQRSISNSDFVTIGFVDGHGTTTEEHHYSYKDENVSGSLRYRLKQVDFDGSYEYSDVVEVEAFGIISYGLSQNYPNPFNPITNISYTLPTESQVKLSIYNPLGELVETIVNKKEIAGKYDAVWNAGNYPSGVYIYTLDAVSVNGSEQKKLSKKMILLK